MIGQHRSTQRYVAEARLVRKMNALAERHPRFGYRVIHSVLVDAGWAVNRRTKDLPVRDEVTPSQRPVYISQEADQGVGAGQALPHRGILH